MIHLVKSKEHLIYELQQEKQPLYEVIVKYNDGEPYELPNGYDSIQQVLNKAASLHQKIHALKHDGFEVDPIALNIQKELVHG